MVGLYFRAFFILFSSLITGPMVFAGCSLVSLSHVHVIGNSFILSPSFCARSIISISNMKPSVIHSA